mmetsp:Transcript_37221/g.42494  ORF Transcript_37221/g.42494 Transcript_37221/m.42494 type:complete len:103 (-) Transcript_37221:31-339(-)
MILLIQQVALLLSTVINTTIIRKANIHLLDSFSPTFFNEKCHGILLLVEEKKDVFCCYITLYQYMILSQTKKRNIIFRFITKTSHQKKKKSILTLEFQNLGP